MKVAKVGVLHRSSLKKDEALSRDQGIHNRGLQGSVCEYCSFSLEDLGLIEPWKEFP
jgi:hypothetical protein